MKAMVNICLVILFLAASSADLSAAGRYTMHRAKDGSMIRLDTQTGIMSRCSNNNGAWQCTPMKESETAVNQELDRLRRENKRLKADVKELEGLAFPGGKKDTGKPQGKVQLPSEQDLDKMMTYFQRMFRKFKDKLKEFEDKPGNSPKNSTPL